ncbi:MAG: tyrosine-type recombinase/integrase [Clostridia bacterium]|nr:tyrosine-type recombinase/integrase [Clostridia bacterium]
MKKISLNSKQINCFVQYLQEQERSEKTIEKYVRDIRCFAGFIGQEEIEKQSIIAYKSYLAKNYAVTSANSMIAALNCFLRFCDRHDLCVKQFRIQRQVYCPEEKELSRAEYLRLLEAAKTKCKKQLYLIIQTICGTGIRVSELEYITIEAVQRGEAVVNCKGKNRRIFIVSELKKKLIRFANEKGIGTGPIFITRNGRPISRHYIWKEMKSLCRMARVEASKVFPHNLRHLFARTFYGIEKDIAKLADILGHASINTTRIYIVTTGTEHKRKMEHMRLIL